MPMNNDKIYIIFLSDVGVRCLLSNQISNQIHVLHINRLNY